ncbi:AMY1.1 [Symbiodinium sp. CCMP2592]|nr:AMY1.1 [Symbiodinium sp. CCMP2592]
MLGQGFMDQYDLELDARTERLRAWPRASLPVRPSDGDWRQLEALGMPGRLQGLLMTVPGCLEPIVGLVDTGASHTVLNRQAAYVLGLRAHATRAVSVVSHNEKRLAPTDLRQLRARAPFELLLCLRLRM